MRDDLTLANLPRATIDNMEEPDLVKAVFDNAQDAVVVIGTDRRVRAVNPPFTRITGYTADETIGKTLGILRSGRHPEQFFDDIEHALTTIGHWRGEVWERRKNGEIFPVWENISIVRDNQNRIDCYVLVLTDIGTIKKTQERLDYLAHHDSLTGLPNRLHFQASLDNALAHATRYRRYVAVMYIDLDRFKHINDTLGHAVGDEVVKVVGRRIRDCVRAEDTVARLGGDEFAVLLEQHKREEASFMATKIISTLQQPIRVNQHTVTISSSVGISVYPDDGRDGNELVRAADTAMYQAKQKGQNIFQYYEEWRVGQHQET